MVSYSLASPRVATWRNPLGRYHPKSVSRNSRWKLVRQRRAELIHRIGGEPDAYQAKLIDMMLAAEWEAFLLDNKAAECKDFRVTARLKQLSAEYNRQLILLDRDFQKTISDRAPAEEKPPTLDDYLQARGSP